MVKSNRLDVAAAILWRRPVAVVLGVWGALGSYDLFASQIAPSEWQTKLPRLSEVIGSVGWPWHIWIIIGLILLILLVFEGAYHIISDKDEALRKSESARQDSPLPKPLVPQLGSSVSSTSESYHHRINLINDMSLTLRKCYARVHSFTPLFQVEAPTSYFPERGDQLFWLQSGAKGFVTIRANSI